MRIAIDGTMLARGGGLIGLVNVLESWHNAGLLVDVMVYVSRSEVSSAISNVPGAHKIIPFAVDAGGRQALFLRRQTILGRTMERDGAHIILSTNSLVGGTSLPQVVHHQNVLWFMPINFLQKVQSEGLVSAIRHKAWAIAGGKALRKARANIFVSAYLQSLAERSFPESATRNYVVHNGLSKAALDAMNIDSPAIKSSSIAAVTSPNPHKENSLLIRSLKQLTVIAPEVEWRLKIAGKGSYELEKKLAHDLGVSERISWLGFLSESELDALLRSSVCLLFPSSIESFGNPPLEAMARKCPVVACDGTAISEVCGDAALLVKPRDFEQLAVAVNRYWCDEALRREKINRGLKRALDFSWERSAQRIFEICKRVAENS